MATHEEVKRDLIRNDPDFRVLFEQHQEYEKQLNTLGLKRAPSLREEVQAKELKVQKLRLKDQMEERIRDEIGNAVSA